MERRLTEIRTALTEKLEEADNGEPVVTAYYARLNELVSAVLVESHSGQA